MKVMNEIKAEISGEILDVLVENGEPVEFGQPLYLVKPD
jgi:biotin carboxyl carrier protein